MGPHKSIGASFGKSAITTRWEGTSHQVELVDIAQRALLQVQLDSAQDLDTAWPKWRAAAKRAQWPDFCPTPLRASVCKVDQIAFRQIDGGQLNLTDQLGKDDLFAWQGDSKCWTSICKLRQSQLLLPHQLPVASGAAAPSAGESTLPSRQVIATTLKEPQNATDLIGPPSCVVELQGPPVSHSSLALEPADVATANAPTTGQETPIATMPGGQTAPTAEKGEVSVGNDLQDVPEPGDDSDDSGRIRVLDTWGTFRLLNTLPDINPGHAFILRDWYRTNREQASIVRELRLPPGWKSRSADQETLNITSKSALLNIVSIMPAANAPAGDYTCQIIHHFEDQASPPITIPVTIKPYFKLGVNAESLPPALSQGEPVSLSIYLKNFGNTSVQIHPKYTSNLLGKIEFSPASLTMQPGEGGVFRVDASNIVSTGLQNDWVLNCRFLTNDDRELGKCSAGSSIFASGLNRARTYENSIDTQLQWLYASDGNLTDLVWQWSGSGYINAKRTRKVDFFLQVPGENYNGSQDPTYKGRLSFYDLDWRVDLGDSTYILSPLTQPGVLARGLRVYRNWRNYQAALFALKERDYTLNKSKPGKQLGGSLIWTTDAAEYIFEILDKRRLNSIDTTALSPDQRVYSAQMRTIPRAWGRLLATLARNGPCKLFPQESESWAYQIGWQAPFKSRWQGSAVWTTQQPGYWGGIQDRREGSLALSREWRGIYLNLQGFYGRDNLRSDPSKSGLQSTYLGLTLRRALPWRLRGSLGMNYRRKLDRTQMSENDSAHGIAPGLAYSGDIFSIDSTLQVFRARDYLKNYARWPQLQPQLNVECQLLSNLRLFWNGSWGTSPIQVPFVGSTGHRLGLFWNTSDRVQLNFATSFTNSQNQRNQNYSTEVTWRPWDSHLIKLNYNSNLYPRTNTPNGHTFTLNYSIFFSLPSGRSTGCDLRGQVTDEQDPKSSHRYIVCLGGRKSLTSESGQYVFSNVPAGNYPVWVENLPPGKVENDSGIQMVDLTTGQLSKRDIKVASGAKIQGYVRIYRDDKKVTTNDLGHLVLSDGDASRVEGIAGAVITLKEETGTRRLVSLTDAEGRFEFGQVHPGKWVVVALEVPVPENYKLSSATEQTIEVGPSSEYNLDWKIVGVQRKIKMLSSPSRAPDAPSQVLNPPSQRNT